MPETAYLITLFLLLALMSGRFRLLTQQLHLWLYIYFLVVFLVELTARYLPQLIALKNNHFIHNLGMPLYITSFVMFAVNMNARLKKTGLVMLVVYLAFALYNLLFGQGWGQFNTYSLMVASCSIVWLTGRYFVSLLHQHDNAPLHKEPLFWINAGFFFFYLCNVFAAGTLLYFLKADPGFARLEIRIIQFLNLSLLLSVAIGILCLKPRPEQT
ncbi:MAG: hypothetical protein MUC87_03430 [Bacteroidia bacterium]|jgi:hypothetical protein|nr:hypothetical protein [Bacteroidia bacterium]